MKHAREDYNRFQDPLGIIPEDEPVMLFRGQDKHASRVLRYYANLLEMGGSSSEMIKRVYDQADLMDAWPTKKAPDLERAPALTPPPSSTSPQGVEK